jgi:hypothetical protein
MSMNLARLIFILTFLIYELFPDSEKNVSVIQEYFLFTFIGLWALSSFLSILEKTFIVYKALTY